MILLSIVATSDHTLQKTGYCMVIDRLRHSLPLSRGISDRRRTIWVHRKWSVLHGPEFHTTPSLIFWLVAIMQDDEIKSSWWLGSVGYLSNLVHSVPRCRRPTPWHAFIAAPEGLLDDDALLAWGWSDCVLMHVLLRRLAYETVRLLANHDENPNENDDNVSRLSPIIAECQLRIRWDVSYAADQKFECDQLGGVYVHVMQEGIMCTSPSSNIKALK